MVNFLCRFGLHKGHRVWGHPNFIECARCGKVVSFDGSFEGTLGDLVCLPAGYEIKPEISLERAAEVLLGGGCSTFTTGARAMYEQELEADEEYAFDSPEGEHLSDWCRDMLRVALEAIRDQKGGTK